MKWTVGMPAETQLSIAAMILGGAFDKLPKKLKLLFAHGLCVCFYVFVFSCMTFCLTH